MADLEIQRNKGLILRSKEKDLEEGEKCTRYFFKRILTNKGVITNLKNGEKEARNTEEILEEVETFYADLYNKKEVTEEAIENILGNLEKKIDNECAILTQDFTLLELTKCMKDFKTGKSPESDGLLVEFYSKFWDILAPEIVMVFKDFDRLD